MSTADLPGRWPLALPVGAHNYLVHRQLEPEGRALALDAREIDPAAVRFDDLAGQREPEADPGNAARARLAAKELAEHARLVLGRDPEALVVDARADRLPAPANLDPDPTARRRVLDGVREQVDHHLRDALAVRVDGQRLAVGVDVELVLGRVGRDELDLAAHELPELE